MNLSIVASLPRARAVLPRLLPLLVLSLELIGCGPPNTALSAPPSELGLDRFYKKHVDADGIPIVSSEWPEDDALLEAKRLMTRMLAYRPDVQQRMVESRTFVAVIAAREQLTDIPEYRRLYQQFPGTDWNQRARGLGATPFLNLTSAGEENLLCAGNDRYRGESVLIHEYAHSILNMGLEAEGFRSELLSAYADAIQAGLWANTYAASNVDEYWAEAAQSWFDTNLQAEPTNGIHNAINTRAELKAYDPRLAELVARVYGDDDWLYDCP